MEGLFDNFGYIIGAIVGISFIVNAITKASERHREKREAKEAREEAKREVWDEGAIWPNSEEQALEVAKRNTGIMMQTMRDLGCQPEKEEDNEFAFRVSYQGETFTFFCANPYIRVYDLGWSHVDVKDPEFATINEAMNAVNFNGGPKVVMTDPDENGIRYFHSHTSFLLHPGFSQNPEFMKGQLSSFFSVKEDMRNTFHQLVAEQQQATKKRNPVGFTTGTATESEDKTA